MGEQISLWLGRGRDPAGRTPRTAVRSVLGGLERTRAPNRQEKQPIRSQRGRSKRGSGVMPVEQRDRGRRRRPERGTAGGADRECPQRARQGGEAGARLWRKPRSWRLSAGGPGDGVWDGEIPAWCGLLSPEAAHREGQSVLFEVRPPIGEADAADRHVRFAGGRAPGNVRVALFNRYSDANGSARVRFACVWAMVSPALTAWFRLR